MPGELVLLSGGLDSTVCMALADRAREEGALLALSFDYGQRHRHEIDHAAGVAGHYRAEHLIVQLDTSAWGGSALTDDSIDIPAGGTEGGIPATYVPARNSIFLAVALGVAEARQLDSVWIGVNAIDYSGYPDCRPEFIEAFRAVAATGQKRGSGRQSHPDRRTAHRSDQGGDRALGQRARCSAAPDLVVLSGRRSSLWHVRRMPAQGPGLRRGGRGRPGPGVSDDLALA